MKIRKVRALVDTYGKDLTGDTVDMLEGTVHLIAESEMEWFLNRPTFFVVYPDAEVLTYKIENGVAIGIYLPDGTYKLFDDLVGLSNVDNTSDLAKPISTATQAALDAINSAKVDKGSGKGLSTEDYTTTEKNKLAGITAGATVNDTDANLKDRANHTGTQAISTVTGLQTALDSKQVTVANATDPEIIDGTLTTPMLTSPAQLKLAAETHGLDLIDDDSFATASASNVPSAESVKAYVDTNAGGGSGGSGALYAANMTALRAIPKAGLTNGDQAVMQYHTSAVYGGGGTFIWNSASSATDNNGTVIASDDGGTGRWLRAMENSEGFYVDWYGAKSSNSSADGTINKTAIQAAIANALAYSAAQGSGYYAKVIFNQGNYYTDAISCSYADCSFEGQGSGVTQLIQTNTEDKPTIYLYGGVGLTAFPYGGVHDMTVSAGTKTFPAVVYVDTAIDNQVNFNNLHTSGSGASNTCDGLSVHNFLNMTMDRSRGDRIGGYQIRIRQDLASSSYANTSGSAWHAYRWTAYDTTTGVISFTSANNAEMYNGTACLLFTTGVLPTMTSTGLALVLGTAGTVYYMGNCSEGKCTLHDTEAQARAGTNPILLTVATGSGTHQLCTFQSSFQVTGVVGQTITFTNDKNVLIPTAVAESGITTTYGTGNTTQIVSGGAGAAGGIHAVIPAVNAGGTLDTALTVGTAYYPIYVDAKNIKLASSIANAVAGTAITLNGDGTGTMVLLYDAQVGTLGIGGVTFTNLTYDNNGAGTTQTTNTIARGGLGLLYANYHRSLNKGTITIEGHRIEVNKMPAKDPLSNAESALVRVEVGKGDAVNGVLPILVALKRMTFDLSVSVRGEHLRVVGNSGTTDLAPSFEECKAYGFGSLYNNDRGTAFSKTMPMANALRISAGSVRGNRAINNLGANQLRLNGSYYSSDNGVQTSPYNDAQFANSMFKRGDIVQSRDLGVVYYQAVQSTYGFSRGNGTVDALGGVTVSATAGTNKFILSARTTSTNFGNGSSVTIPGAGIAAANITGTVANFQQVGTGQWDFELCDDTTGEKIPCSTTIASVTVTYNVVKLAKVRSFITVSADPTFTSIAANTTQDKTIAAPTGITFTAGKPVILGIPSGVQAGLVFSAFVTSGGNSVTVRCANVTVGAITPNAGTYTVDVAV